MLDRLSPSGNLLSSPDASFPANSLIEPSGLTWPVPVLAPLILDPTDDAIIVRQFTAGADSGVGGYPFIPQLGSGNVALLVKQRVTVAPATPQAFVWQWRARAWAGTWQSRDLPSITLPASTAWTNYVIPATVAGLFLTPGDWNQFELIRNIPDGYAGDVLLGAMGLVVI